MGRFPTVYVSAVLILVLFKGQSRLIKSISVGSLVVTKVPYECKRLTIEGTGCEIYEDSVLTWQFFFESKLF